MAYAVIRQYFHPVIAGDLAVEIVAPGRPKRRIDARTIEQEARRTGNRDTDDPEQRAEALVRAIALAKWGHGHRTGPMEADGRRKRPAIPEDQARPLRDRYRNGERLAFRVGVTVAGRRNRFRVFIERDDTLTGGHDYFVRGHLHIPRMDYLVRHRARALVVVDNRSDLGHLLRDAEGPSHEKWRADAPRLKEKGWPAAAERVREVQHAAARILDALAEKPAEVQRDALSDLFPRNTGTRAGAGGGAGTPPRPDTPPAPNPLGIRKVRSGFELAPSGTDDLVGSAFAVRMAYDVARGTTNTAFSRFDRGLRAGCPDFSLGNGRLAVDSNQCEVAVKSENEVHIRVGGPDFSFSVNRLRRPRRCGQGHAPRTGGGGHRSGRGGTVIRRFNSTGRVAIPRSNAAVTLRRIEQVGEGTPVGDPTAGVVKTRWSFNLKLDLDRFRFPADARIRVEAWRGTASQRWDWGTVGRPAPPDETGRILKDVPETSLFRVSVIEAGDTGLLLGLADRLRPKLPVESLLPLVSADLGGEVWRFDYGRGDDLVVLKVNEGPPDFSRAVRTDPGFRALVMPQVLRSILERALLVDREDPGSRRVGGRRGSTSPGTSCPDGSRRLWIAMPRTTGSRRPIAGSTMSSKRFRPTG